ncbi:hypothetical protein DH2020_041696 [Rehmannia glutinosa]|uniref:Aminotransferase-like plant mobile domain-containing protein n=1 Tax=Rehmannia glutinosa TaxID=99300 RepID=A0ABR0UQJ2_REHGL
MDSGLGHTLHPGPIDDSILTLQDHHRSTDIWDGQNFEPLTCRRCDGHFWRLGTLDPQGFEAAGRLSWGGAVLACLYRALCRASKPETSDICGPLVLLQIWAWERVPFIRPGRLAPRQQPPPDIVAGDHPLPVAPYGSRWNVGFKLETVGTHVLVLYRDQLDNMKDDQGVGGAMEAMVDYDLTTLLAIAVFTLMVYRLFYFFQAQSLQKIYHRATDAMNEGYEVCGEDVLREIQDICAYSLRAAHEDHRLAVRPDLRATSPVASPFLAPKVQRGRPRKRGGLTCGRATESRRRGSYVPVMQPTSSEVSYSFKPTSIIPANVGEPSDTPQTWDSSLSAPEFQEDTLDPNTMQLGPEATGAVNAQLKISMFGHQIEERWNERILDRCEFRDQFVFSMYPGASSPTPSASLGPNDSPSLPHDSPEQDVEPLVTPLSRETPLPEFQDNLQLEMIELDTITGSREASPSPANPSMLDLPSDPPDNQDSAVPLTGVKEDNAPMFTESTDNPEPVTAQEENGVGTEILPPKSEPPASEPCGREPVQPEYADPTIFNWTHSSPQGASEPKRRPSIRT